MSKIELLHQLNVLGAVITVIVEKLNDFKDFIREYMG